MGGAMPLGGWDLTTWFRHHCNTPTFLLRRVQALSFTPPLCRGITSRAGRPGGDTRGKEEETLPAPARSLLLPITSWDLGPTSGQGGECTSHIEIDWEGRGGYTAIVTPGLGLGTGPTCSGVSAEDPSARSLCRCRGTHSRASTPFAGLCTWEVSTRVDLQLPA